jgi:putative component of membrane protein insertase Oxa1/YidC/SpoIIIJ protein YidD
VVIHLASVLLPVAITARPLYQEPWGKDSAVAHPVVQKEAPRHSLAVRLAEVAIDFHQKVISPVDGPRSHFRPSSSQYMRQAMHNYGFLKGFVMGCDRLLRENSDEWVYRKIEVDGEIFKYDPPTIDKY